MTNKLLLLLAVVLLAGAGGYFLLTNQAGKSAPTQNNSQSTTTKPAETIATPSVKREEVTVNVTASGFTPDTITVKSGTRVVWINKSGAVASVYSDLHPSHLLYPALNLGRFENDSSVEFVFEKSGKFTYHDHIHPDRTGVVVVE